MASLNKVQIIGGLGRDPEVKFSPSGLAICKFPVATSEDWTDKATGEKKSKTEWHKIVVFGKLGENCGRYLSKGKQVYVEGKLQTSSYEKDGITRYSTDIMAHEVKFLSSKDSNGQTGNTNGGYQQQTQYPQQGFQGQPNGQGNGPGNMNQRPQPQPNYQPPNGYGSDQDLPF